MYIIGIGIGRIGQYYIEIWIKDVSSGYVERIIEKAQKQKNKSYKQRMIEKFKEERDIADSSDNPLKNCVTPGDLLRFDKNEAYEPYSRERRGKILRKTYKASEKRTLLYAAEGFGKSFLAKILINEKNRKVLFACQSNKQVAEQAKDFESQGKKRFDKNAEVNHALSPAIRG